MAIKLFKPYTHSSASEEVKKVLESGNLAEGEKVKEFEREFGKKFKKKNVLALNSGTSALELAYDLAGIEEGDEVITPILTCTATNLPLIRRKAKIVFADIDTDLNVSIDDIKSKITEKTKAIVFVHFGGNNRGLKELLDYCEDTGIKIIEDAAQAVGSDYWGVADYAAVSLQAIKNLNSGDGGMLICRDRIDHKKAKRLRWFGYDRDLKHKKGDTDIKEAGYKYHMNEIAAAIGLANLRHIDELLEHKRGIGELYRLTGLFAHSWLAGGFTSDYRALKKHMDRLGIEIGQHHFRNDKYSVFKDADSDCPTMDALESKYFFIPYHFDVTPDDALNIVKEVKKYAKNI